MFSSTYPLTATVTTQRTTAKLARRNLLPLDSTAWPTIFIKNKVAAIPSDTCAISKLCGNHSTASMPIPQAKKKPGTSTPRTSQRKRPCQPNMLSQMSLGGGLLRRRGPQATWARRLGAQSQRRPSGGCYPRRPFSSPYFPFSCPCLRYSQAYPPASRNNLDPVSFFAFCSPILSSCPATTDRHTASS